MVGRAALEEDEDALLVLQEAVPLLAREGPLARILGDLRIGASGRVISSRRQAGRGRVRAVLPRCRVVRATPAIERFLDRLGSKISEKLATEQTKMPTLRIPPKSRERSFPELVVYLEWIG